MTIRKDLYDRRMVDVRAGKVIFSEGDPGTETFILISGAVEISKRTSLSTSKTLITLKPGDIFGEMAIIEQMPRSATAIAVKDSRLLSLDESLFFQMIEKNPDFAVKVVKILCERIRRTNATIQQLSSANRETRIIQGLKEGKFIQWACAHIGMGDWDVAEGLQTLIEKKYLRRGAKPEEYVLAKEMG
jgi:CRP-like cAMP-binding protein